MKLFVPSINSKIALTEAWRFLVQAEHRNTAFLEAMGTPQETLYHYFHKDMEVGVGYPDEKVYEHELPSGTVLAFERIYIRKGAKDFDSITFGIVDCPNKRLAPKKAQGFMNGRARFWVSRRDANQIDFDLLED
jgi:hypothetical protein